MQYDLSGKKYGTDIEVDNIGFYDPENGIMNYTYIG